MGTSTRYRDQPTGELPDPQMTTPEPMPTLAEISDRVSARPIPEQDRAILTALDTVNASLRVVLAAIAELKAEMNQRPQPIDATQLPDTSWVGTP